MTYTARTLITRAYYLSQVVSRELQTVSADQITDGLALLNALLTIKSTDTRHIPYYQRSTFNTVAGQEEYFVEGLLNVDAMTFNIGNVRYSMNEFTRAQYFAISRVDNIQSLPFCYRLERELGGTRIFMYFVPADVYVVKISGKYAFSTVTLDTDLQTYFDDYYIEYLRYALAEYICSDYGATLPDLTQKKYEEINKKVITVSPPDLSIQGDNYFGHGFGMDWQTVNLTTGWWPF